MLTLCSVVGPRGGTWGTNDTIVFAPDINTALSQVPAAGGQPQALTKLKENDITHRWPQFLPDGKSVLYVRAATGGNYDDATIVVHRLDTGEDRTLIRGGTYPRYVPTGHLVYYRAGTIMVVPFDASRLEIRGTPAPAVEGVMAGTGGTGLAQFSTSSTGALAYVAGGVQNVRQSTLVWVDRKGEERPLPAPAHAYDDPRLSPDGKQIAVQITDTEPFSVWVYDIPRGALARLTFAVPTDLPIWTPDGKRILFESTRVGSRAIYWMPADGSGPEERLMPSEFDPENSSITPDGQFLGFAEQHLGTGWNISILPLQGERKPKIFLQTSSNETAPMFSPDGRWLAYSSNESGQYEIYVRPFPGPGGKWLISTDGGTEPVWARNGRELFYRSGTRMMGVDIQTQPSFKADTPRMLFERPGSVAGTARADYDVSPDGQRFLMIRADEEQETALTQINVVLNWFEELKRLIPTESK